MTGLRARTAIWAVFALVPVLVVAVLAAEPFVYVRGGVDVAYAEITPRVIGTGLPHPHERMGGLITADLDGDGRWDFVITGPGRIGAVAASGARLWSTEVDIQVTGQAAAGPARSRRAGG